MTLTTPPLFRAALRLVLASFVAQGRRQAGPGCAVTTP